DIILTLSNLDSTKTYTLVALGMRGRYNNRWCSYVISGVDNFTNASSAGAEKSTASMENDTTTYLCGDNYNNGYVAKWTDIDPTSTTITLTISGVAHNGDAADKAYLSAIKLVEEQLAPEVAISLTTDGLVEFDIVALGATKDSSGDVQIIRVDAGPANLNVKSTVFSDNGNSWSLESASGLNQVKWEFSPDTSAWNTFLAAGTLYYLVNNVVEGNTQDLYLRITMPTETSSSAEYSSMVTIVATAP
ncbi:unnamed protein product, partial [marine sediment metagenome]